MKKLWIVSAALLVTGCGEKAEDKQKFEQAFVTDCVKSGGDTKKCQCVANHLTQKSPLKVLNGTDSPELSKAMQVAIEECLKQQ